MAEIDSIDQAILAALSANGRMTMTELAGRVGLTKTPAQARVRRMEAAGIIRGYVAVLDPVSLGRDHVAFVQVTLDDTRGKALADFNRAVLALPEVEQCHMIAGSFDYLLKVRSSDIRAYRRIMGDVISALPHVASTSTFVSMESVKEETF